MSIEVKVPTVGESISSGVIASWNKKDGDIVAANEPLFTLETDKVSSEIVAEAAGRLTIKAAEGEEVKIGQVVALIEEGATSGAAAAPKGGGDGAPKAAPSPSPDAPATAEAKSNNFTAGAKGDGAGGDGDAPSAGELSPAVRRMIEEEKLDASAISGTGKGGRITKEDITAFIESRNASGAAPQPSDAPGAQKSPAAAPAPAAQTAAPTAPVSTEGRETRKKLSPLRRKIAAQLVMAQQTAAILTTFNECDMSGVMALRSKMQDAFVKKHGIKLGFMSFFIKAAVDALKAVPAVNGRMDGEEFVQNNFYDIGVAVGTDKGLFVPVVRDCDKKGFAQLEKDIVDYAKKARDGKIGLPDLQGGGFTITNGGTYGSLLSTPILNPPQSGILGMHNIVQRPVVVNGEIVIRPMMYLALSYDHRVVDGKEAVTFLVRIKDCIEDPTRLLLEV